MLSELKIIRFTSLFLFLVFISSNTLFGQDDNTLDKKEKINKFRISTRIGLNSFTQLNTQIEYRMKNNLGMLFNIGYRYGSGILPSNTGYLCASKDIIETFAKKGLITNIGMSFRFNKNDTKYRFIHVTFDYRLLGAKKIQEDKGCFGGSNTAGYSEYKLRSNEYGIKIWIDFHRKEKRVNPYLAFGISSGSYTRNYLSESSSPFFSMPSDRIESGRKPLLRFDVGIRI